MLEETIAFESLFEIPQTWFFQGLSFIVLKLLFESFRAPKLYVNNEMLTNYQVSLF